MGVGVGAVVQFSVAVLQSVYLSEEGVGGIMQKGW